MASLYELICMFGAENISIGGKARRKETTLKTKAYK
jgi:hypothetical protein